MLYTYGHIFYIMTYKSEYDAKMTVRRRRDDMVRRRQDDMVRRRRDVLRYCSCSDDESSTAINKYYKCNEILI